MVTVDECHERTLVASSQAGQQIGILLDPGADGRTAVVRPVGLTGGAGYGETRFSAGFVEVSYRAVLSPAGAVGGHSFGQR